MDWVPLGITRSHVVVAGIRWNGLDSQQICCWLARRPLMLFALIRHEGDLALRALSPKNDAELRNDAKLAHVSVHSPCMGGMGKFVVNSSKLS